MRAVEPKLAECRRTLSLGRGQGEGRISNLDTGLVAPRFPFGGPIHEASPKSPPPLTFSVAKLNTESTMDPVQLFITTLGTEVLKATATDTAKAILAQVKSLLGLSDDDAQDATKVQAALDAHPAAHPELTTLMQAYQAANQISQTNIVQNQGAGINFGHQTNHFGR